MYPLWLCPFKLPSEPGLFRNKTGKTRLYIDVGAYGNCLLDSYDPVETGREIEDYVRDNEGY